jgi:hypothetical protein
MTSDDKIVQAMHAAAVCILAYRDIECVACGFTSDNVGEAVAHLRQHGGGARMTAPGDRIRIVEVGPEERRLHPGDEYVVEFVTHDGGVLILENTEAALVAGAGDRWELVEEKAA